MGASPDLNTLENYKINSEDRTLVSSARSCPGGARERPKSACTDRRYRRGRQSRSLVVALERAKGSLPLLGIGDRAGDAAIVAQGFGRAVEASIEFCGAVGVKIGSGKLA